jgi:hypothetical protein
LQWWNIPRRGWIIILGELAVIIGLVSWVYSEYLNNAYLQSYVNSLSPILLPVLSVGFGLASATVATLLYFTVRNLRRNGVLSEEDQAPRRVQAKKTVKRSQVASPRSERTSTGGLPLVPRPRVLAAGTSGAKRSTAQDGLDEEDESG